MFEQIYKTTFSRNEHYSAPYAQERISYLKHCELRGDSLSTIMHKAGYLLYSAKCLETYRDLQMTFDQIYVALFCNCEESIKTPSPDISALSSRERSIISATRSWLRFLGFYIEPVESIPYRKCLDDYCDWAKNERGLSERTIFTYHHRIRQFLQWYGTFDRSLRELLLSDCDSYIACCRKQGSCRITIANIVHALRAFLHFGAEQNWCHPRLAKSLQVPRIYSAESLPSGLSWSDAQRLFTALDLKAPKDVRALPILILLAVYGLRSSEVTNLRFDDIDWQESRISIRRAKRGKPGIFPLTVALGNALTHYIQDVRRPSEDREIFQTLISPYKPLSQGGLYNIVSAIMKAQEVNVVHQGPHALRHTCARRLITEGLPLKEIGDHLGHRSYSATRVYAKVDIPGLREVAAFDLGDLS